MPTLGVNIDHIATLRQARQGQEPDPIAAAVMAELAGADGITVHLREDRRHIQDRDVQLLRQTVQTHLNLEMAATEEMVAIALGVKPDYVTLVPERREEITTEGGLDVVAQTDRLAAIVTTLQTAGIPVSLFIDPQIAQVKAALDIGAKIIELHTGHYATAPSPDQRDGELRKIVDSLWKAKDQGVQINAGHGLNYQNVGAIARIPYMQELNIGHAIVSRAVLVGLDRAIREMKAVMTEATTHSILTALVNR